MALAPEGLDGLQVALDLPHELLDVQYDLHGLDARPQQTGSEPGSPGIRLRAHP